MSKKRKNLSDLLMTSNSRQRAVTLITLFRFVAFPVLLLLVVLNEMDVFKWLLLASFLTDAVDGYLARKYEVTSTLGAKLDSLGDDLTILAALTALIVVYPAFLADVAWTVAILILLFVVQTVSALIRYRKPTSFHTYLAKLSAVLQAAFILSVFFLNHINYPLFYVAAGFTILDLLEEVILVFLLPEWRSNVKGLYWIHQKP